MPARLTQLDGLRGPLSLGVVAINMGLYNAGANTPVGFFFVFSGLTSYLAYHGEAWDDSTLSVGNFDASRGHFFQKRLVRLLPMLLISAVCQQCACVLWLFRRGVAEELVTSGGAFTFVVYLVSSILIFAGSGAVCRGTACGCCQLRKWPRAPGALVWLILGSYLHGPGWYVGLLLLLNVYFLPKLLAKYGAAWRAAPPSWLVLLGWASLEGLQFGLPLLVYVFTDPSDPVAAAHAAGISDCGAACRSWFDGVNWYFATLYLYLGLPPLFRLVTFVFGLHIGRWTLAYGERASEPDNVYEAKTMLPVLATALVVTTLHGFLEPEPEMHRPTTGSTPLQWVAIHLIHPFNTLALLCGLVAAPKSLVARALASPPFQLLAELSYAIYLLHCAVCHVYVFTLGRTWYAEIEKLQTSADAPILNALDYLAVCALTTALAYPVTRFVEPKVAAWLKSRFAAASPELL